MSFCSELRRRSVFKVGAAYAIVAWLLLQISDVVLPTFNTPQWVLQTITFLLILGLPVALILAWAFDLTPEGIKTAAEVNGTAPGAPSAGPNINTALLALLVLAVGSMAIDQYVLDDAASLRAVDPTFAVSEDQTGDVAIALGAGSSTPTRRSSFDIGGAIPMGANAAIEAEPTISSDGRRLVFSANLGDGIQLHSRLLDEFDAQAIPDISPARVPFISPDGLWVGYGSSITSLSKVSTRGGRPVLLTDEIGLFFGGSWGDDDRIIFSTNDATTSYLARIPAAGGAVERLTAPEDGVSHRWPEILPGGQDVLLTLGQEGRPASEASIAVLSLETNEIRSLIPNAFNARYVPTGHLVFARETGLWAVPFELEGLNTRGEPAPVIYDVQLNTASGHAPYGFSDDGVLYDCFELAGNVIVGQPEESASLAATYRAPLGAAGWEWSTRVGLRYTGEWPLDESNTTWVGSASELNASVTFSNDNWDLTLFGSNLTDEDALRDGVLDEDENIDPDGPPESSSYRVTLRIPREYGVRLSYRF